ncbi:MAG TPA: transporter substrate-binding domain-containing protein, partial [Candidatus Limnocylindria bacterium]|nr:transporter substrate-binding domain-containing protein [Candidatus Limnocylindria bacterium]
MRKAVTIVLSLLLVGTFFTGSSLAADRLDSVKAKGVLVAGVKDSLPPFGYIDQKTRTIVGYDIDFVHAIAKKLGVKVELKPVTSATRMPQLQEGNIDIIAATMTKNAERAKVIDFSHTYFLTGQKFLTKTGTVK